MRAGGGEPLGVALTWHCLAWPELRALVERAEELGYAAAYLDGDVSQLPSRGDADVLDGIALATALLATTRRIQIAAIHLVHHWNAAKLAQHAATLERIAPDRQRLLISIGGQPADRRFGLALPPAADRIVWLDEMLDAARALWRGEEVRRAGRFVALDGARVRPVLRAGRPLVEVAGRGPRLLRVVARYADAWNVNVPPLAAPMGAAEEAFAAACAESGRDPAAVPRAQWLFARPDADPDAPERCEEYRRWNPWFAALDAPQIRAASLAGDPASCRERIARWREQFRLALPVVDLSGLPFDAARHALDALAPRSPAAQNLR